MSYENSDRHRVAWSREKKEANNIYEGNEGYFWDAEGSLPLQVLLSSDRFYTSDI